LHPDTPTQTLKDRVAAALATRPEALVTLGESYRYAYFSHQHPGKPAGFVKAALESSEKWAALLQRESEASMVVRALGIPTPRLLTPYTELYPNQGFLEVERIEDPGWLMTNAAEIADADPLLGRRTAEVLARSTGCPILPGLSSGALKRNDQRNASYDTFKLKLQARLRSVLESTLVREGHLLLNQTQLLTLAMEVWETLPRLRQLWPDGVREYFVHNDSTPINMFFPLARPTLLLDLEYAGATRSLPLAYLTDFGRCYARMWENPAMQRVFVTHLPALLLCAPTAARQVCRLALITGTILEAGEVMNPAHHRHKWAISLINNLQPNLALI
jgi:hypothetical protein